MKNIDYEQIMNDLADLEKEKVIEAAREIIPCGEEEINKMIAALSEGMEIVGERFEFAEYFIGDLIEAANIMIIVGEMVKLALPQKDKDNELKVVLCTVENDIHDIGKNIVRTTLEAAGVNVIDLGVNVSKQEIIDTIEKENAKVVALSGVMSTAIDSMREVIEMIRKSNALKNVKIVIGGACVYEAAFKETGADAWGVAPKETKEICLKWLNAATA